MSDGIYNRFGGLFLDQSGSSHEAFRELMNRACDVLIEEFAQAGRPYSGADAKTVREAFKQREICPEEGAASWRELLDQMGAEVVRHAAVVTHPAAAAHLHCPPLMTTIAAEAWIAAMNQSLDSWDQSMSGTMLEEEVVAWLCRLYGFEERGDGVFTSGGTQSNFMGLLLARNHYSLSRWGWNIQKRGLPARAGKLRVLCSEEAHFTVKQSMGLLGLGEQAVVTVPTDSRHRMRTDLLQQRVKELASADLLPFAIVATAGTTDFGSIDPLPEIAALAQANGLWLHVDAAYGGALAMSDTHRGLLEGLSSADSVTVDFHKWFYQPVSCGAFLVRDQASFRSIHLNADYLNPEEDEQAGVPNLVAKSIQTTRRFDALKLYMSLQQYGRRTFGDMVDSTMETARQTARLIREEPSLELAAEPELSTVVFRYVCEDESADEDDVIHGQIRDRLLSEGWGLVARTRVQGRSCLKLTILNPLTSATHTALILRKVTVIGRRLEREQVLEKV